LFKGAAGPLASHRGWDPGALEVTRLLARKFGVTPLALTWSRLLVESNRAPTNPRIWSRYTAGLPAAERDLILARYWWPHRRAVARAARQRVAKGRRVLHVAVHSFTGVLAGEVRNADIGLLYDPARPAELAFCRRWEQAIRELDRTLRVRRNYPYRGTADGLPTWLRRQFPDAAYAGVELELNQATLAGSRGRFLRDAVATSLARLLGEARY
jgi:predicted N-formylglutamate amidohydrolase